MGKALPPEETKKMIEKQDEEFRKLVAEGPKPGTGAALAQALAELKKLQAEAKSEAD